MRITLESPCFGSQLLITEAPEKKRIPGRGDVVSVEESLGFPGIFRSMVGIWLPSSKLT